MRVELESEREEATIGEGETATRQVPALLVQQRLAREEAREAILAVTLQLVVLVRTEGVQTRTVTRGETTTRTT